MTEYENKLAFENSPGVECNIRREKFSNPNYQNKNSMHRDSISKVSESQDADDVLGANEAPKPRMERRKSSIFSIIQTPNAEIVISSKPKPCIPVGVQQVLLAIFVFGCIVILWLTLLPLIGFDVYQGIVAKRLGIFAQNFSLPTERILANIDLSNKTVNCPDMYIFVPNENSCKPQCGHWSGCGRIMYFLEKYTLIVFDTAGIIVGILGFLNWVLSFKDWQLKHFAIFVCIIMAFISSLLFAAIDLPGSRYLYCSNEVKQWNDVKNESRVHIEIFSGLNYLAFSSLLFWLWFALINISLPVFFTLSATLQFNSFYRKLFIVEAIFAWGLPVCIIGLFIGVGGKFNLQNAIQHPTNDRSPGRFIIALPIFILFRLIITTFFIILYRIRSQILKTQKFASKTIKIGWLEKRFIGIGVLYVCLITIRTFYASWVNFSLRWDLQNRGYDACITLESSFTPAYQNMTYYNLTIVADLLPMSVRNRLTECSYPCIIPIRTIVLRISWIFIFSITSLTPIYSFCSMFTYKLSSLKNSRKAKSSDQTISRVDRHITTKSNLSSSNTVYQTSKK